MIDVLAPMGVSIAIAAAAAIAASLVLVVGAAAATRSRRRLAQVRQPLRWPVAALAFVVALGISSSASGLQRAMGEEGGSFLAHTLLILAIVAGAWLLVRLLRVAGDGILARYGALHGDRRARKVHTQVEILRRVLAVVVVVIACGAVLFTFEAARVAGTSLLASAGVASLVAGLAAQSVLGNVFAGIQLVASDAIRVDDVVVVEGEWGTIEEITLTYVVVRLWDDRRLVLPSTHFTTTPFQNWTRTTSEVMGAVELDVDWRVPVAALRVELERILAGTDLWDGRAQVLQVTDAVGGFVRVRVLVTAADGPTLFDLRAHVRELLVEHLQSQHAHALPRQRVEVAGAPQADDADTLQQ